MQLTIEEILTGYPNTNKSDWFIYQNGGGWVHKDAQINNPDQVYIGKHAIVSGGQFYGGSIHGGRICGGEWFKNSTIHNGQVFGGRFLGGSIYGGVINQGVFMNGKIMGGSFYGGIIRGGFVWGGTIIDGTIFGGVILGGSIYGGRIFGGTIINGEIHGGDIHEGTITKSDDIVAFEGVISPKTLIDYCDVITINRPAKTIQIGKVRKPISEWKDMDLNVFRKSLESLNQIETTTVNNIRETIDPFLNERKM